MSNADAESKHEKLSYSFFVARESSPLILLNRTRRKKEPPTAFAPMGSMLVPAIRRVWNDTKISKILIPEDYIHCCAINPLSYEEVSNRVAVGDYPFMNTLLVEYNRLSTSIESEFGMFLIHLHEDSYVLREFARMRTNRYIAKPTTNDAGQGLILTHVFEKVSVQRMATNNELSYFHQFTYRHTESSGICNFYIPIYAKKR